MIAHAFVAPALLGLAFNAKGEFMANQRDRDTDDLNKDMEDFGGSGGTQRPTPGGPSGERMGGRSEENVRGTGDDSDEDEFEDTDDMDDEEEDEGEGTI